MRAASVPREGETGWRRMKVRPLLCRKAPRPPAGERGRARQEGQGAMREEEEQQQEARRRRRRSPSEVYKRDALLHSQPGLHRHWPARRLSAPGAHPRRLSSSPPMDYRNVSENCKELTVPCSNSSSLPAGVSGTDSSAGQRTAIALGRPAAANAARERSRVQTLRHAFLELQRTLPSVPPDTKLSKLDVLLLATTYIAHLTRSLQDEEELPGEGLGTLRGDGYLHPVKKWPMRSRLYIGATGQFLSHSAQTENTNQGETSTNSQM